MKQIAFLFAIFVTVSSHAQITIQSTDLPKGGNIYLLSNGNPLLISDSGLQITGANQNWNFNLTALSQGYDTAYSMSQVPLVFDLIFYSSSYADRLAQNITLGTISISDIYSFYKVSSSLMEETGTGASISGLPTPTLYNPKDVVYHFPMNYGNADSCNFAFSDSLPTIGQWIETGTRVNHIDGWGTLSTPFGSKDVLRVHSDLTYNDSIYVSAFSIGFTIPRHQIEYKWLAKNGGFPMLEVVTTVTGGTETVTQILYQDTLNITGIVNIPSDDNILIYPQPSSNGFIITAGNNEVIDAVSIYDLCGRLVKKISEVNQSIMNISTSDIPAGLYPVVLQCRDKNYESKISVIH